MLKGSGQGNGINSGHPFLASSEHYSFTLMRLTPRMDSAVPRRRKVLPDFD